MVGASSTSASDLTRKPSPSCLPSWARTRLRRTLTLLTPANQNRLKIQGLTRLTRMSMLRMSPIQSPPTKADAGTLPGPGALVGGSAECSIDAAPANRVWWRQSGETRDPSEANLTTLNRLLKSLPYMNRESVGAWSSFGSSSTLTTGFASDGSSTFARIRAASGSAVGTD
jgi:hypothetical protein